MDGRATRRPIDVPTRHTVEFVCAHVPANSTVLEVGSGSGEVAKALAERAYAVTGVEPNPDAVARALEIRAPVIRATWMEFDGPAVDAVVFARSLHHIHDLHDAVRKAAELVVSTGKLVIEDFAYDEIDTSTLEWFREIVRSRAGRELLDPSRDSFIAALLEAADPVDVWRRNHDHDDHPMHTARAIHEAVARHFTIETVVSVPYLYRYLVPALPGVERAEAWVASVFDDEQRAGRRGSLQQVGRRLVASKPR